MAVEDMRNNMLAQQILVQMKVNVARLVMRSQNGTLYIRGVLLKQNEQPQAGKFQSNKRLIPLVEQRFLAERTFRRVMWELQ